MASSTEISKWLTLSITLTFATVSTSAAISVYFWSKRRATDLKDKIIKELQNSLNESMGKCAAERQGRIRAQQDLRKAMLKPKTDKLEMSYPMAPIGIIRSCFSTRNGTPRQPLIVPLARARLMFDTARVPPASLEGLEEYSHCWIIYVFHLNTDLDKLWKHPSRSKLKAKVRVPRMKGEKMGLFATRSPHRPCPIGLTVAKVESVQGTSILLSGVDLVDGTPVLDIKPYLPYCDSIKGAVVPDWVKVDDLLAVASVDFSDDFFATLTGIWPAMDKKSLYTSAEEFKRLIKQVLSWDIRSVSQRSQDEEEGPSQVSSNDTIYHLNLEGLDVTYRITSNANVLVDDVTLSPNTNVPP
ncbi:tRNA (adenine(37)-N6)-methyltransferase isoform X2 [Cynara cardunculus var. scolymus]|nr:tRNA (adenine(37)-N6)-methyltransferase isoform X2 [Cynara cardunculus var. scolymus]